MTLVACLGEADADRAQGEEFGGGLQDDEAFIARDAAPCTALVAGCGEL